MTALRRHPLDQTASSGAEGFRAGSADPQLHGAARHAYWWALLIPLFWGAGLLAFNQGAQQADGLLTFPAVRAAVLLALTLTPVGVALFAAYVVRQGSRLAEEARLTRIVAEEMATPALIAAALNGRAMTDVTEQIVAAEAAARAAGQELAALRLALAEDARALVEATAQAVETGDRLRKQLGGERVALEALNARVAEQSGAMEATLHRSVQAITGAAELAQAQLGEAEAALAARAASLDAVTAAAAEAGRAANEDLARQALRLDDSAAGLSEQMRQVEAGLNAQRAALTDVAAELARDHERRSEEAETQRARLDDALIAARFGAVDIREQSALAAESVRELLSSAGDQLEALTVEARDRRATLETETREALARVDGEFAAHRETLERDMTALADGMTNVAEVAVRSAELFGEIAKRRLEDLQAVASSSDEAVTEALERRLAEARAALDALAEASFNAARQADAHFESRLNTARRLVDRSAALVDDAGEKTATRIEAAAAIAKSALTNVQGGLDLLDGRLERLPVEARQVSEQLTRDLDSIVAAARDAADETRAIDDAFQERIRRNYEVLSQAARLMDDVSARAAVPPTVAPPPPAADAIPPRSVIPEPVEPTPEPAPAAAENAIKPEPRTRLRLKPAEEAAPAIASDDEFQDLFVQAGGPALPSAEAELALEAADDGWTWRGLLGADGRLGGRAAKSGGA